MLVSILEGQVCVSGSGHACEAKSKATEFAAAGIRIISHYSELTVESNTMQAVPSVMTAKALAIRGIIVPCSARSEMDG